MKIEQLYLLRKKTNGEIKRPLFNLGCYSLAVDSTDFNLACTGQPLVFFKREEAEEFLRKLDKIDEYQVISALAFDKEFMNTNMVAYLNK